MKPSKLPSARTVLTSRVTFLVVAVVLIAMTTVSTSVAAKLITGKDIKNNSVTGQDVKNKSLAVGDLSKKAVNQLKGATGPKGPAGPKGATGPKGPAGASGVIESSTEITDPNPAYLGVNVVDIPASPANGSADSRTPMLTFTVDAGTYYMSATAQFFHFTAGEDALDYGVFGTDVNGVARGGTSFTSDIPNDIANGAQSTAAGLFTVAEDDTEVTVVGSIRGDREGQAGAEVTILKID